MMQRPRRAYAYEPVEVVCVFCGTSFVARNPKARYCSGHCAAETMRIRQRQAYQKAKADDADADDPDLVVRAGLPKGHLAAHPPCVFQDVVFRK